MSGIQSGESPLFKKKSGFIYKTDFIQRIKELDIKEGDCLFIHSDIRGIGKLVEFDTKKLFSSMIGAFKEVVGSTGTLIMPTFTYNFCRGTIFNKQKSKSTVGVFTEYFRNMPGVVRTSNPIFSVSIWGAMKEDFSDISNDSFGENSIFGKMHKFRGKFILIGTYSLTYIHYIEKKFGVPYRYMKEFKGKIQDEGQEYESSFYYYVRYLDRNVNSFSKRFQDYLLEKGLMRSVKIGHSFIHSIEANLLFKEGMKLLGQDQFYFLKEKPYLYGL